MKSVSFLSNTSKKDSEKVHEAPALWCKGNEAKLRIPGEQTALGFALLFRKRLEDVSKTGLLRVTGTLFPQS